MNVTATDKGTAKNAKITITNNKGRLSKDEIERLIKDAEKYKDADEKIRKRVEAKNALESYCVSVKHSLSDDKLKDKFDSSDKNTMEEKVRETESWLSSNPEADTAEYEGKLKALENIFNPIMQKIYAQGGVPPGGAGFTGGAGFPGGPGYPGGGPGNTGHAG